MITEKNWRHVYKALVVMEYLVKNGSQRVVQQCKDNIFSIETLKDFHFTDKDGKDTGEEIRKRAKNLVALLRDEEQLTGERQRSSMARDRIGRGNLGAINTSNRSSSSPRAGNTPDRSVRFEPHIDQSRPRASDEEDLQLQLALRMSKEQAEEEDKLKKQEDESLRLALELSKKESTVDEEADHEEVGRLSPAPEEDDLLGLQDPWSGSKKGEEPPPSYDLLNTGGTVSDPWGLGPKPPSTGPSPSKLSPSGSLDPFSSVDPFASSTGTASVPEPLGTNFSSNPPWMSFSPTITTAPSDPFTSLPPLTTTAAKDPYDFSNMSAPLSSIQPIPQVTSVPQGQPSVEKSFLGDNANLVNLDALVAPLPPPTAINPFGTDLSGGAPRSSNPFEVPKGNTVTLDQMKSGATFDPLPPPLLPGSNPTAAPDQSFNPFLS